MRRVGFIGLGNMGEPMAVNLAKRHDTMLYDLRFEALNRALASGGRAATSVAEVARHSEILGVCVLYDEQVREVFFSETGILANAAPGLVALVHSTVPPQTVEEISAKATEVGVSVLDAPVTGARIRSEEGALTIILAGEDDIVESARPYLDSISNRLVRVGSAPGNGQRGKLVNNLMFHCNHSIVMEAMRFAEACGLSQEDVLSIVETGTGGSWVTEHYEFFSAMGREHTLANTGELPHRMAKDLRYVVAEAGLSRAYVPIAALCSQIMPEMLKQRWYEGRDRPA